MATTTISQGNQLITLINVFTVEPDKQQQVANDLAEATDKVMNKLPGFISANIHVSLDGTKVVNYAQWRSQEDFEAMMQNPDVKPHMAQASELAKSIEPNLYRVAFVDHA